MYTVTTPCSSILLKNFLNSICTLITDFTEYAHGDYAQSFECFAMRHGAMLSAMRRDHVMTDVVYLFTFLCCADFIGHLF